MDDYIMPDKCRFTRQVEIYYVPNCFVTGFKFFDTDLIFEVGTTEHEGIQMAAVDIGTNEQIIGVKANVF
jgi:hypothetical protein